MQEQNQWGAFRAITPLKPTKITSFTMILYNSESDISKPFPNKTFVMFEMSQCSQYKAILLSVVLSQQCCEIYFISHTVMGADMRLDYQILLKSPPNVTR